MTITAKEVRRARGRKWKTDFEKSDIMHLFRDAPIYESFYYTTEFSLTWFVEQIICKNGKPLRLLPFQQVILGALWNKKFPMMIMTRGGSKTFLLAVYAILRALLHQGSKIVVMGAGFRQAKHVFRYIEELYDSSPLLQEAIGHDGGVKWGSDTVSIKIGRSTIRGLPIGDGSKVRGERATHLLADEFASIPESIFDHAVAPFTSVGLDPEANVRMMEFMERVRELGADDRLIDLIRSSQGMGNQIVYSGSACNIQNHFGQRYMVNKAIINSKGDRDKLRQALKAKSEAKTGKALDISPEDVESLARTWHQYVIIQLPYTALPAGFMEEDIIRGEKASLPYYRFQEEYLAQFTKDTDGFIRRSWIDAATPKLPDSIPVPVELYGDPRAFYVMGVDAARWNDNMAAVVMKLTERGYEVVYCEAWNRTEYEYSANKIREICRRFNIQYIAMDKGGGGDAVLEHLYKAKPGIDESDLLWPIPEQLENKADLAAPGRRIVDMVNFSPAWISMAAHSLEANIQQKHVMFPERGDDKLVRMQYERHFQESVGDVDDNGLNSIIELLQQDLWGIDSWEADVAGIESKLGVTQQLDEMTNEACAIIRSVTPGGVEKFELPKLSEQPEGLDMRRRDRWSALMLANYAAKTFMGHGHKHSNVPGVGTGSSNAPRGGRKPGPNRPTVRRKGSAAY